MTDGSPGLRLRHAVDRELWLVVGIALLLVLAGGWLAYDAYATEERRTLERTVASWESSGAFDHRATVVNGTAVFDEGAVLSNREVYFRTVTPVLNGSFAYSYTAEEGSIDANVGLSLVTRSFSEERRGGETEYWRVSDPVDAANGSLAPGERLSVPFSINVSAAALGAETAERQFGGTPGQIQHVLVATVDLEGSRNGEPVDTVRVYRLPMRTEQGIYRLSDPGRVLANGSRTEQYTVPVEPGPLGSYGGPALLVLGVVGLLVVAVGRATGRLALSDAERERLVHGRDRREFDEWITVARSDVSFDDAADVDVDSLSGLVDLAIDASERVVETPSGEYVVRHDGMVYTYAPPAAGDGAGVAERPAEESGTVDPTDGEPVEEGVEDAASGNGAPGDDESPAGNAERGR